MSTLEDKATRAFFLAHIDDCLPPLTTGQIKVWDDETNNPILRKVLEVFSLTPGEVANRDSK